MLRKRRFSLDFTGGIPGKSVGGSLPGVQKAHDAVKGDSSQSLLAQTIYAPPALNTNQDFEPKENMVDNIYLPRSAPDPTPEQQRGFGQAFVNWWNTGDWK